MIDSRTADGPTLVWSFFGYSSIYGRWIGLAEMLPALCLWHPRTRMVGALGLFAISLNLTIMDFCFAFPAVKYFALLLTALSGALLLDDLPRVRAMFILPPVPPHPRRKVPRWIAYGAGLPVVLFLANLLVASLAPPPGPSAEARCAASGIPGPLTLHRWILTQGSLGILRKGFVELEAKEPARRYRVDVSQTVGFLP